MVRAGLGDGATGAVPDLPRADTARQRDPVASCRSGSGVPGVVHDHVPPAAALDDLGLDGIIEGVETISTSTTRMCAHHLTVLPYWPRHLTLTPFPRSFGSPEDVLSGKVIAYHVPASPSAARSERTVFVTLGTIFNTESGDLLRTAALGAASARTWRRSSSRPESTLRAPAWVGCRSRSWCASSSSKRPSSRSASP